MASASLGQRKIRKHYPARVGPDPTRRPRVLQYNASATAMANFNFNRFKVLYLWTSLLRRIVSLKSYVRLPLRSVLWLLSKLQRVIHLGSTILPFSDSNLLPERCRLRYHDSFICDSQQPSSTGRMRAKEQSHLPEISQIPGSATNTSIHLSESNTSLSLDPTRNTSREAVALTMSAPSSVILEVPDQDIGCVQISGARPDLSREVEGLVPIAPTQIDRYNRKEIMYVLSSMISDVVVLSHESYQVQRTHEKLRHPTIYEILQLVSSLVFFETESYSYQKF